ncbi:DUF7342 family protein [Natrinema salifodinae]|uniref:Transcriptional regulator n=1 Tax=Natrinema salifodinae TaxID=1202768 RepID=A0A1I0N0P0_9EURY|nr:hypothetical protein [Natrinema salifodinae]SEV94594.1 hypothetical protein SAMN05216285_1215 [Natrinema salifodinae]
MAKDRDPGEFDDVNEAVSAEWEAETTSYERVREIIGRAYIPVSADAVADAAGTSPKTARKHLNDLDEGGFVMTVISENGGTTYRRSPESLVTEQASDIRDHVSADELGTRVSEMRDRIRDLQTEYDAESPELLTSEDIDSETVREWQTTRRNLAFASAALATESDRDIESEPDETSDSD